MPALIGTKSVYEPADPSDGRRILVTQYWPRGVPGTAVDEYVRRLAPSRELLHAFKRGDIGWEGFRAGYLQEMENEEAQKDIRRLAERARSEPLTIMCVCRDESSCHRTLLRDLIISLGEGSES